MNDNYAVINGKRVELTDEQLKALGIEKEEKRKNPFERACKGKSYFYIGKFDDLCDFTEFDTVFDRQLNTAGNYFNDKDFANQVSLHQLLYRKLLKYAYDNECEDNLKWGCNNKHHYIFYSHSRDMFGINTDCDNKSQNIYFSSSDAALRAIREVVKPFMKEHPDFVW